MVADSLEAQWNDKHRELAQTQQEYEHHRDGDRLMLDETTRSQILALAKSFPRLWRDPDTCALERKRMVVGLEKASCLILLPISARCMILGSMVRQIHFLLALLTSCLRTRLSLQLEIAALRHQLSLYRARGRRPRIAPADRLL